MPPLRPPAAKVAAPGGPIDESRAGRVLPRLARGRGSQINPPNRFERLSLHVLAEHVQEIASESPDGRQFVTRVLADRTRSIINKVESPDLGLKWTVNPYRGCEHGCVYCYARPGHEMLGLSSGLDFETTIIAKRDAPALLRRELARSSWRGETIVLSGVTDPWQPVERELRITRGCLEVMAEAAQAVAAITKSRLILRDLDLLAAMASRGLAAVAVSLTTLDNRLSATMEPRAAAPRERLEVIRRLSEAGVPVRVMTAPIVPGLNDYEIPRLLEAAAGAGAVGAGWVLLRLPHAIKDIFADWLERELPQRAAHVRSLLRQCRGGRMYDATFGQRLRGNGPVAEMIGRMFEASARLHGLETGRVSLAGDRSRVVAAGLESPGRGGGQLSLFTDAPDGG